MIILQVVEEMSHVYTCGDRISRQKNGRNKNSEARMCQPYLSDSKEVSRLGSRWLLGQLPAKCFTIAADHS